MSELPQGWVECQIGEVAKVVAGGTPPSGDDSNFTKEGGIPWLTPADLSGYKKATISRGARNLSEKGFQACSAVKMPEGSVLFSSRAPVGYVVISENQICTNQGFKSFVLPDGLESRWVYLWLRHIKPIAEMMATGTTFKELSGAAAKKLPLLVAPTPEQTRIADKLDALLARVDAARTRLDRIPHILKRFRQSVLAAATSGELTREWRGGGDAEWEETTLGEIIAEMRNGLSAKPDGIESGSRILRISAVRPLHLDVADHRYLTVDQKEAEIYALKRSDVLFTRYNGSLEFVGVCAIVETELDGYVYPDKLIRVRVRPEKVTPEFLIFACSDGRSRNAIEGFVKSSAGQKGISGADLKSLFIELPPLEEQTEIVRRVESLFALADKVQAQYDAARARLDQLTPALLAKAFRGELVPQDPNDEPAEKLLERLRAAKANATTPPGKRRKAKVRP